MYVDSNIAPLLQNEWHKIMFNYSSTKFTFVVKLITFEDKKKNICVGSHALFVQMRNHLLRICRLLSTVLTTVKISNNFRP